MLDTSLMLFNKAWLLVPSLGFYDEECVGQVEHKGLSGEIKLEEGTRTHFQLDVMDKVSRMIIITIIMVFVFVVVNVIIIIVTIIVNINSRTEKDFR